jgi:membrane-associated protein
MDINIVSQYLNQNWFVLYPMLFLIAWIEGPILMLACGFLVRLGHLNPYFVYPVLVFGDLFGDFVWYAIGHYGGRKTIEKVGRFFNVDASVIPKVQAIFDSHQNRVIFVSKVTMGFGFAIGTLMAAGMSKVRLVDFGLYNLLGGFVFTGILMSVGYLLGQSYTVIGKGLDIVSTVAGFAFVMLLLFGFGKYMRERFNNNKIK